MDNDNVLNVILEPLLFDKDCFSDPGVKELQDALFPTVNTPKVNNSGGFLTNFLLKFTNTGNEERSGDANYTSNKDSKDLFSIIKEPGTTIQPPRWPTECQVLDDRINHIPYVPEIPQPYYNPSGEEVQPKPVGEECGLVVYQYYPISAVNYFSRSSIGGSRYLLPTCPCPEQDGLRFESRFECGNLAKALRITATFYELHLRTDLYTNKHMQWFYFRVKNMKKDILYRFSIVNMTKDGSLFNEGLKPLIYSERDAEQNGIGWRRFGNNITYFCNENGDANEEDQQLTYTLTFTFEFPHDDDACYFAYSYPYSYTDLQNYLLEMSKDPYKSSFTTLRLLCKTLAGNNVYYVTITSQEDNSKKFEAEEFEENINEVKKKKAVVITARVHPGETPSSWMMKGFLDFLTSDTTTAKELREKFIFKLVPMLNPDGVIVGNNRCSLTGRDLNRQYRTVIRETYPSIWYTKLMIRRLIEECGVAMYCDLHAHSRKHNIFVYGCENRRYQEKKLHEQVFPLMLRKNSPDKFSFEDCKFRVQKNKEGTGRVVMWMMGIQNSYTMEASFGGSLMGMKAEYHFTTQDYEQMGKSFCQTLLDFYDEDPRKERLREKIIDRLLKEGSNADEPTNIALSDYSSDEGDTNSSSDEGGGPSDNFLTIAAPPSTPETMKKYVKPKSCKISRLHVKQRSVTCSNMRKTYNMSTSKLKLSSRITGSCSGSESDEESSEKEKLKRSKKISKKTKRKKKGKNKEVENEDFVSSPKTLSVLDILSFTKFKSLNWNRSLPRMSTKSFSEYKTAKSASLQLAEVQLKLLSLQNKLWMGSSNDINSEPLSWGPSNIYPPSQSSSEKIIKHKKKSEKSNAKHQDKKTNKIEKKEVEKNIATVKKKPQTEKNSVHTKMKLQKSKSFPDTSMKNEKKVKISNFQNTEVHDNKTKKRPVKSKKKIKT